MRLIINKQNTTIPEDVLGKWQSLVNTMADVVDVPVALINQIKPPYLKVLCSNESSRNPYQAGYQGYLADTYDSTVVANDEKLLVANSKTDQSWVKNPAISRRFISHLGLPLHWPDGEIFGTICVLDTTENSYTTSFEKLMLQFQQAIETHLALLCQNYRLELLSESLGDIAELNQVGDSVSAMAVITTDCHGNIIFWNRTAQSLFGYSVAEATGKPLSLIMAERFRQEYDDIIQKATSLESPDLSRKVMPVAGLRKDGIEFPMEITHTSWRNREGLFFTAVVRVLTERKQIGEMLQKRNRELTILNTIAQSISRSMTLDEILPRALDEILETTGLSAAAIFLFDETSQELTLVTNKGLTDELIKASRNLPALAGIFPGVETVRPTGSTIRQADSGPSLTEWEEGQYLLALPLSSRGQNLGAMVLSSENQDSFPAEYIQLMETISTQIASAIDNAQLFQKVSQLSITDELTGVYNHRHFSKMLLAEIARIARYGGNLSLVMLDLDGFKAYNDRFGHVSGDAALKAFGQTLKTALRKTDIAFRYGGDEFAIILPATEAPRAREIVKRIKAIWLSPSGKHLAMAPVHIGFSAGIAQFPQNGSTNEVIILLADTALYHSKRQGKYRFTLISDLAKIHSDIEDPATQDRVSSLLSLMAARHPELHEHTGRVVQTAILIAKTLGLQKKELAELKVAALLHDIGKIGSSNETPGQTESLSPQGRSLEREHAAEGARIAGYAVGVKVIIPMIRHHHERYDGQGYPQHLKGQQIPLGARIIAVADAYDNLTYERPESGRVSRRVVLRKLRKLANSKLDPGVTQSLF